MDSYGLVLAGGGAKGSYEIGAWKAIKELEIPISVVAGASVGALNAAIIVQDDYDTALNLWTSLTMDSVIKVSKELSSTQEVGEKFPVLFRNLIDTVKSRGLDVTPLKELLKQIIDEDKIRKSLVDLGIVTFSLTDFKPMKLYKKDIPEGELVDYLLASSCFPAFKSQEIGEKKFIDGGVYDNIPVSIVTDKNIKNVIIVDISGPGYNRKIDMANLNAVYIKNSEDLGMTLDFNGERSKKNIEIGYYDTLKAFGKYKGNQYYIIKNEDYEMAKEKYIQALTPEDLRKMYKFLGIDFKSRIFPTHKLIIDRIIGTIEQYCEGKKLNSNTVFPAMAEITAEELKIERIKPLTLSELVDEILLTCEDVKTNIGFNDYIKNITNIIHSNSLFQLDSEIKKFLMESKFLISYDTNLQENDEKVIKFRRFIAATFPKIAIANLFISFVLSKKDEKI